MAVPLPTHLSTESRVKPAPVHGRKSAAGMHSPGAAGTGWGEKGGSGRCAEDGAVRVEVRSCREGGWAVWRGQVSPALGVTALGQAAGQKHKQTAGIQVPAVNSFKPPEENSK